MGGDLRGGGPVLAGSLGLLNHRPGRAGPLSGCSAGAIPAFPAFHRGFSEREWHRRERDGVSLKTPLLRSAPARTPASAAKGAKNA